MMIRLLSIEIEETYERWLATCGTDAVTRALSKHGDQQEVRDTVMRMPPEMRDGMARRLGVMSLATWLGIQVRRSVLRLPPREAAKWTGEVFRALLAPTTRDGRIDMSVSIDGQGALNIEADPVLPADYDAGRRIDELEAEVRDMRIRLRTCAAETAELQRRYAAVAETSGQPVDHLRQRDSAKPADDEQPSGRNEQDMIASLELAMARALAAWRQRFGPGAVKNARGFAKMISSMTSRDVWAYSYGSDKAAELHLAAVAVAKFAGGLVSELVEAAPTDVARDSFVDAFARQYQDSLSPAAVAACERSTAAKERAARRGESDIRDVFAELAKLLDQFDSGRR